jgi:5'/3'-nucleotidase SurE
LLLPVTCEYTPHTCVWTCVDVYVCESVSAPMHLCIARMCSDVWSVHFSHATPRHTPPPKTPAPPCVDRPFPREQLHRAGYDLKVVAAKREQSAKGHSITLFGPIDVESFKMEGVLADVTAWMVDGTPVDCVKIALTSEVLEGWKPDLVVSGINRGSNTGMNVHYSGTCGVAREANMGGLPAIALSLSYEPVGMFQFDAAAKGSMPVIAHMLERILQGGDRSMHGSLINVNFPNLPFSAHRGYKITAQGRSTFENWCEEQSSHVDDSTDPPVVHKVFQYGGRMVCLDADDSWDTKAMNGRRAVCLLVPELRRLECSM